MKIKLGQLKKVSNHKRKFGSALSYNAVYVEFDNGNTVVLLLSDDKYECFGNLDQKEYVECRTKN